MYPERSAVKVAESARMRVRRKMPLAPRPYRCWGYPVVPVIFVVAAGVLLYYTFTENIRNSVWGVLVMVAGIRLRISVVSAP